MGEIPEGSDRVTGDKVKVPEGRVDLICYNVFRMMNLDVKYGSVKEYYRKVVQEKQGNHGDFLAAVQVWIEKHNSNPTMARLRDTDAIKNPCAEDLD